MPLSCLETFLLRTQSCSYRVYHASLLYTCETYIFFSPVILIGITRMKMNLGRKGQEPNTLFII